MKFFPVLLLGLIIVQPVFAQETPSPEQVREQANAFMTEGKQLADEAQGLLQSNPQQNELRQALSLYIDAGKRFERANQLYTALGPAFVPQQLIAQSQSALDHCLNMIQQIQQHLTR